MTKKTKKPLKNKRAVSNTKKKPLSTSTKTKKPPQKKGAVGNVNKKPPANTVKPKKPADKNLVSINIKKHKDKNGGHPHVIVEDFKDKHISVGLSTKPNKGKGSTNYILDNAPLGGGKISYMRRQGTVDPKDMYFNPQTGQMTPKDFAQAKRYGDKAKRKYKDKK